MLHARDMLLTLAAASLLFASLNLETRRTDTIAKQLMEATVFRFQSTRAADMNLDIFMYTKHHLDTDHQRLINGTNDEHLTREDSICFESYGNA